MSTEHEVAHATLTSPHDCTETPWFSVGMNDEFCCSVAAAVVLDDALVAARKDVEEEVTHAIKDREEQIAKTIRCNAQADRDEASRRIAVADLVTKLAYDIEAGRV